MRSWAQKIRSRLLDWRYGQIDPGARIGKQGEQAAARMLRRAGYKIVSHSETDRGGEIDLIATDRGGKTIVFVEVKTLTTTKPGHPADRVDGDKQARISRAALRYLKRRRLLGTAVRFDVIAIWWHSDSGTPDRIEHYPSAFECSGDFQMF